MVNLKYIISLTLLFSIFLNLNAQYYPPDFVSCGTESIPAECLYEPTLVNLTVECGDNGLSYWIHNAEKNIYLWDLDGNISPSERVHVSIPAFDVTILSPELVAPLYNVDKILEILATEYGYVGITGNGYTPFNLYVRYGDEVSNAIFDSVLNGILFGSGNGQTSPFVSRGVVAHELAHAIVEHRFNPTLGNHQVAAVVEALCDIISSIILQFLPQENHENFYTVATLETNDNPIRRFDTPNDLGFPSFFEGPYYDFSGNDPHHNSPIISHLYFLIRDESSDFFIGVEDANNLFMNLILKEDYLNNMMTFNTVKNACIQLASDKGYTVDDREKICDAFSAVGLNCSGIEPEVPTIEITEPSTSATKSKGQFISLQWTADNSIDSLELSISYNGNDFTPLDTILNDGHHRLRMDSVSQVVLLKLRDLETLDSAITLAFEVKDNYVYGCTPDIYNSCNPHNGSQEIIFQNSEDFDYWEIYIDGELYDMDSTISSFTLPNTPINQDYVVSLKAYTSDGCIGSDEFYFNPFNQGIFPYSFSSNYPSPSSNDYIYTSGNNSLTYTFEGRDFFPDEDYIGGFSPPCQDIPFPYNYSYHWTFGDGVSNIGNPIEHTFQNVGTYQVCLEIFDENNNSLFGQSHCDSIMVSDDIPLYGIDNSRIKHNYGSSFSIMKNPSGDYYHFSNKNSIYNGFERVTLSGSNLSYQNDYKSHRLVNHEIPLLIDHSLYLSNGNTILYFKNDAIAFTDSFSILIINDDFDILESKNIYAPNLSMSTHGFWSLSLDNGNFVTGLTRQNQYKYLLLHSPNGEVLNVQKIESSGLYLGNHESWIKSKKYGVPKDDGGFYFFINEEDNIRMLEFDENMNISQSLKIEDTGAKISFENAIRIQPDTIRIYGERLEENIDTSDLFISINLNDLSVSGYTTSAQFGTYISSDGKFTLEQEYYPIGIWDQVVFRIKNALTGRTLISRFEERASSSSQRGAIDNLIMEIPDRSLHELLLYGKEQIKLYGFQVIEGDSVMSLSTNCVQSQDDLNSDVEPVLNPINFLTNTEGYTPPSSIFSVSDFSINTIQTEEINNIDLNNFGDYCNSENAYLSLYLEEPCDNGFVNLTASSNAAIIKWYEGNVFNPTTRPIGIGTGWINDRYFPNGDYTFTCIAIGTNGTTAKEVINFSVQSTNEELETKIQDTTYLCVFNQARFKLDFDISTANPKWINTTIQDTFYNSLVNEPAEGLWVFIGDGNCNEILMDSTQVIYVDCVYDPYPNGRTQGIQRLLDLLGIAINYAEPVGIGYPYNPGEVFPNPGNGSSKVINGVGIPKLFSNVNGDSIVDASDFIYYDENIKGNDRLDFAYPPLGSNATYPYSDIRVIPKIVRISEDSFYIEFYFASENPGTIFIDVFAFEAISFPSNYIDQYYTGLQNSAWGENPEIYDTIETTINFRKLTQVLKGQDGAVPITILNINNPDFENNEPAFKTGGGVIAVGSGTDSITAVVYLETGAYITNDGTGRLIRDARANLFTNGDIFASFNSYGSTCSQGGFIELDTIFGIGGMPNYQWSNGETGSSIEDLSPGIYSVTISDAIDSITMEIEIEGLAPLNLPTPSIDDCGIVTLNPEGGTAPYRIYVDNEVIIGNTYQAEFYDLQIVKVVDTEECQLVRNIIIPEEISIHANLDVQVDAYNITAINTSIGQDIDSVSYTFDGNTLTLDNTYTAQDSGLIEVCIFIYDNDCGISRFKCNEIYVDGQSTPTEETFSSDQEMQVEISPNPFGSKVKLDIQIPENIPFGNSSIKIYNVIGQEIYYYPLEERNYSNRISFDDSPSGIYFIEIVMNNKSMYREKVIKK